MQTFTLLPKAFVARRRAVIRIVKLSVMFSFSLFCLLSPRRKQRLKFWHGYEQSMKIVQDIDSPLNCFPSTKVTSTTDKFMLKKGWRTNCGKEFAMPLETFSTHKFWNSVLFLRPNAASEGFAPTLSALIHETNFDKYRIYGNHAEYALRTLFSGEEVKYFLRSLQIFESCSLVVATASFGAQDTLHQPLNSQPHHGVCYVAFIDAETRKKYDLKLCEESWNVLDLPNLGWNDPRMKTRIIRALLPFFFPHVTFSVWVDSKLQLKEDPVKLVNQHLVKEKAWLAVSENHVRSNIFEEGEKLVKMFHSTLSVNETYDNFRVKELQRCLKDYRKYGFNGSGLPDAGLFLRAHTTAALEFSLRWTQEILMYSFGRDQISFPFVVWRYTTGGVNIFNKCWYVQAVREVGHKVRSGSFENSSG